MILRIMMMIHDIVPRHLLTLQKTYGGNPHEDPVKDLYVVIPLRNK